MPILRSVQIALPRVVRRSCTCDRGSVLIEAALVVPVLLLLIIGGAEFGRALYAYHTLEKAVRVSSRYLARVRPADYSAALTRAEQMALAELSMAGVTGANANLIFTPSTAQGLQDEIDAKAAYNQTNGTNETFAIRFKATAAIDFPMLVFLGLSSRMTLGASHVQPYIGQ